MSEPSSFKRAAYAHLAEVGKALSSATRLEILELLVQAPRTVESLAQDVGQSTANTSHHLRALARAHLVTRSRQGQHVEYAPAGPEVAVLVDQLQRVAHAHVAELRLLSLAHFEARDGTEPVDADTLATRLRSGEAVLVDVRPEREFAAGHLPGARSIPLSELEARLDELPRDREVIAYCRGPFCTFSADAVRRLRELGFQARRAEVGPHAVLDGS